MEKLFFYKIVAADLLEHVLSIDEDKRAAFLLQLAQDLVCSKSDDKFIKKIISEASAARKKRSSSGRLGGKTKSSNAKAKLKQSPSKALANNSISINNNKEQQSCSGDFFNIKELVAMAVSHLGWNPNITPKGVEAIRPLTAIFKADVERGFRIAAENNAKAITYVIVAAMGKNSGQRQETTNLL